MTKKTVLKIVLPLVFVALGGAAMVGMIKSRQAPKKEVRPDRGVLVEVMALEAADHQLRVFGTGTVQAGSEATVVPQVSGQVVEVSPKLVPGGFFKKGELLFALEQDDYRLAQDQAKAALARAEVELAQVESQAAVAREEWQRLHPQGPEPNPLVVYLPQLKNVRAAVDSARAGVDQAGLNLQRTRVSAPFDGRVRSEQVELGQYLKSGNPALTLVGSDLAEVVVPLAVDELQRLEIPRAGSGRRGSRARVSLRTETSSVQWDGYVVRSLGEVDSKGRMARIVVAVEDPFSRDQALRRAPDLEIGMFVEVEIDAGRLPAVVSIPRDALRDGSTAWVVGQEDRLEVRPVVVARREKETLLIAQGLSTGDRLVLTSVPGASEGQKLRLAQGEASR